MPDHDYTAKDALDLLLARLAEVAPELARCARIALDAGKDVRIMDESTREGRGGPRYYLKQEPYTDEEALAVAIGALEAHLVESRKLVRSAHADFEAAGIAALPPNYGPELFSTEVQFDQADEGKTIDVELELETVQKKMDRPTVPLDSVAEKELESLELILQSLRRLTGFAEE